jgi:hypothetical protein
MKLIARVLIVCLASASLVQAQETRQDTSKTRAGGSPGRFTVKETEGTWWLVDPQGNPFFSRGVCCVNTGASWKDYSTSNPGYAAWQHFPSAEAWAGRTVDSLKAWGFTTIGGWSDLNVFMRAGRLDMPFTVVLHCGSTAGIPWYDMWDPDIITRVDYVAREEIMKTRDHPNLLGYYSDNELGWWNAPLFRMTWEQAPSSGARTRLVTLVRDRYKSDWKAMLKDFDPEGAASFDQLSKQGKLFLRPGGNGMSLIQEFVLMMARRYYELTTGIIRKYSDRALLLGDRYQSFYYPEVARAAADYLDVVSTNFDVHFSDGTPVRYYLPTLQELCRKPLMIGEYYMSATENRSGNRNSRSAFPVVQTQKERAQGFVTTSSLLARTPYVVGADWFQYFDEPTDGREDGEDFNFGLVDIHGKPYEDLTAAARTFDWHGMRKSPAADLPDASGGIPKAPPEPLAGGDWKSMIRDWDRLHGFVRPSTPVPMADLYVCWTKDTLYLGLIAEDFAYGEHYRTGKVPEEDRTLVSVRVGGRSEPLQFRLAAERPAWSSEPSARVLNVPVLNSHRNFTILGIPARVVGGNVLAEGDAVRMHIAYASAARGYGIEWTIDSKLRTWNTQ